MSTTESPPTPRSGLRPRLGTTQWSAFGTNVSLAVADAARLPAARAECEQLLATFDRACNAGRDDSDLARANLHPGTWVKVGPVLIRALTAAVRVVQATGGLIDPEGWRKVGIDTDGAVQVPPGTRIELGGIGRAFAADLICEAVAERIGTPMIVGLGNHIAIGRPANTPVQRWHVAVAERPVEEDRSRRDFSRGSEDLDDTAGLHDIDRPHLEIVALEEGALSTTSNRTRRHRRRGPGDYSLLDSGKGTSLDPIWRTVSVCATSCVDATAASMAAIGLGEQAPAWLWERDLSARLIAADGRILRIAGWPEH